MGEDLVQLLKNGVCGSVALAAVVWAFSGAALFGLVFGIWRSVGQSAYSGIKMPAMILALVAVSGLINIMLAHVLGSRLSAAQTTTCVLLSLALTAVVLAAVSPVALLFAFQCPGPGDPGAMTSYRWLLAGNTGLVGFAGLVGNVRLHRLLCDLTGSKAMASRVLLSWILVTGLAGCELSWIFSPFLARPDLPVPFLNPNAFKSNFFEYLWHTVSGTLM